MGNGGRMWGSCVTLYSKGTLSILTKKETKMKE